MARSPAVAVLKQQLDDHLLECTKAGLDTNRRLGRIEMGIVSVLMMLVVGLGAEVYRLFTARVDAVAAAEHQENRPQHLEMKSDVRLR